MVKRAVFCLSLGLLVLATGLIVWRLRTTVASTPDVAEGRRSRPTAITPTPDAPPISPRAPRATAGSISAERKVPGRHSDGEGVPPSDEQLAIATLRYGSALRALSLTPPTIDQLTRLLVERALIARDVLNVSRTAGLTVEVDEAAVRRLLVAAQDPTDAAIRKLAGESGFAALVRCDEDLRVQSVVTALQQQLEGSSAPLRDDRADALGRILVSTAPVTPEGALDLGTITTAAVSRSWDVLGQPQVAALEQLQRQQEKSHRSR